MSQLFPEVIDGSTLGARQGNAIFLPIGIEGWSDDAGSVAALVPKVVSRPSEAVAWFGAAADSPLTALLLYLLDRGAGPITAISSLAGTVTPPTDVQRKAAWQTLEAMENVRIRMTDSVVAATLAALGVSCDNAALLNNKQFGICGLAAATTKAALITAAGTTIASKRICLVGPAVYDENGDLQTGAYAAASVAAMVALNGDITDDLDTATVPKLTDIEHDTHGNPLFRKIVVAGVVQNDFEDLLQGGMSPLMPGINGGVGISHLRMTSIADGTFDALMTRIILDQLFVLIKKNAEQFNSLRKGNTDVTRKQLESRIDTLMKANSNIVLPVEQGDGSTGYGVTVDSDDSERQQIISYQGQIVRGTQTILVDGNLTIPV